MSESLNKESNMTEKKKEYENGLLIYEGEFANRK